MTSWLSLSLSLSLFFRSLSLSFVLSFSLSVSPSFYIISGKAYFLSLFSVSVCPSVIQSFSTLVSILLSILTQLFFYSRRRLRGGCVASWSCQWQMKARLARPFPPTIGYGFDFRFVFVNDKSSLVRREWCQCKYNKHILILVGRSDHRNPIFESCKNKDWFSLYHVISLKNEFESDLIEFSVETLKKWDHQICLHATNGLASRKNRIYYRKA